MARGLIRQLLLQQVLSPSLIALLSLPILGVILVGCTIDERPTLDQLLPPQIGEYARTNGPATDSDTGVDFAEYKGPEGTATLRIKLVGKNQIDHALSQLPPSASDVRLDPGLGARNGTYFNYAGDYHAAWGNGDWVFILSTSVDAVRTVFLSSYAY